MPFPAAVDLEDIAAGSGGFKIQGGVGFVGSSVSEAGDVNGDGIDDLIVGAPYNVSRGAAYVVFGRSDGFTSPVDLAAIAAGSGGFVIQGENETDEAGHSVSGAGDINGDGIDDVIVGAPYYNGGRGAAYVVFGRTESFTSPVDLGEVAAGRGGFKIRDENADDHAGTSVSAAGDVNGDGIDDLIVGAPGFFDTEAGAAYVVFGRADGFSLVDLDDVAAGNGGFEIRGKNADDRAGTSVSAAGDVNGDGIDDLIVGGGGAAYVVFGSVGGFASPVDLGEVAAGRGGFKILGETGRGGIRPVSAAGDVDGDGIDDVIVGATDAAYVVFGHTGGFTSPVDLDNIATGTGGFKIVSEIEGGYIGAVSDAGDVNGDGIDDLIVGAYSSFFHSVNAYVVFGQASGSASLVDLEEIAAGRGGFKIEGAGPSVSAAGDVDGDGIGDLIVGGDGVAHVIFGQRGEAVPLPVVHLGDIAAGRGGFKIQGADFSVSAAGDVNSDGIDDVIMSGAGAAYVVFGRTGGLTSPVDLDTIAAGIGGLVIQSDDGGIGAVSDAGDVNGDGIDDLIVGVSEDDTGGEHAGAAYVVFGRTGGFTSPVDLDEVAAGSGGFKIQGESEFAHTGRSVAEAGDVNGDGFDDLIVGARGQFQYSPYGGYSRFTGTAYVVFGSDRSFASPVDLDQVAAGIGGFEIQFPQAYNSLSVSSAGDINGDGLDDLIVGTWSHPYEDSFSRAYVVFGRDGGFTSPIEIADIAAGNGGFSFTVTKNAILSYGAGYSVSAAGDVNGDGIDDLIIGTPVFDYQNHSDYAGAAYVVFGSAGSFTSPVDLDDVAAGVGGFKIVGEDASESFGASVSAAGDVNGDGIDDLIVSGGGAAYVVFGRTESFTSPVDVGEVAAGRGGFKILGETGRWGIGPVSAAGDVDGDGIDDLIVGATYNSRGTYAGAAYVIYGRRDELEALFTSGDDTRDLNDFDLSLFPGSQATRALAGDDIVTLSETQNRGQLFVGNAGDDTITGSTHGDRIRGDAGSDTLFGRGGGDTLWGTEDGDLLDGGSGADHLNGGNDADSLRGSSGDDRIFGRGGADRAYGGNGEDAVSGGQGNDRLWGGAGDDLLSGDAGRDMLTGAAGFDVFRFRFTDDSRPGAADRITDFAAGDLIDLSRIDAVPGGVDNVFSFIGGSSFSAAGQLRVFVSGGSTFLQGNTLGNGGGELLIALNGVRAISEGDLVL